MAQYEATARSNYFRVRDRVAFHNALDEYGVSSLDVLEGTGGTREGAIRLIETGLGGWPSFNEDDVAARLDFEYSGDGDWVDDAGDRVTVPQEHGSLASLVGAHLAPGETAVLIEVGFEKARYLIGSAVAVDATGEQVVIDLDDIYDLALEKLTTKGSIDRAHD